MPATKIETGVFIELTRLALTAVARKHNPQGIVSLAKSIQEHQQQLQDIVVCPQDESAGLQSPLFDVLAGGGRKEAEESLGWEKARCTIMYGLSAYEKLKITLDENEEREAPGPLDDARIYKAMLEADKELNQDALAKRLGMKQNTLSEYLSLLKLPADVQEIIGRPINLTLSHILQICRLENEEDQIELANKASEQGLTVKQLASEVTKRVKKAPSRIKKTASNTPIEDPLATAWSKAKDDPDILCRGYWEASYVPKKIVQGPILMGWNLWLSPVGDHAAVEVASWLRKLSDIIAATVDPEEMKLASTSLLEKGPSQRDQAPTPAQEPTIRLPQNSEEWSELKALAAASLGPGPVYAWIFGPGNPMTMSMQSTIWADMNVTDPSAACEGIVRGVQTMSGAPNPGPM